jgi:hypothetical protein
MGRRRNRSFQSDQHRSAERAIAFTKEDKNQAADGNDTTGKPDEHRINETIIARWTRRLGIYTGILAVATVLLVVASGISAYFLWESDNAIEGQLREMHLQTITTRAQVRANVAIDHVQIDEDAAKGTAVAWDFTPVWKNNGPTDALNVEQWYGISYIDSPVAPLTRIGCAPLPRPANSRPMTIQAGHTFLELAQSVLMDNLYKAAAFQAVLIIQGHMEYSDIFSDDPRIILNWCSRIIPNDIPSKKASFLDLESQSTR